MPSKNSKSSVLVLVLVLPLLLFFFYTMSFYFNMSLILPTTYVNCIRYSGFLVPDDLVFVLNSLPLLFAVVMPGKH